MQEIFNLTWQIQLTIIAGYFAYSIAYAGRKRHHQPIDVILIVFAFGGFGGVIIETAKLYLDPLEEIPDTVIGLLHLALVTSLAILWRSFGQAQVYRVINKLSKNKDDGLQTAWDTIIQEPDLGYSQLNVLTRSGTTLECYPLGDFNETPNGPCVFGIDGSIALYVTHISDENGSRRETSKLSTSEGIRMTFVPAHEIVEVDMRRHFKKKKM